MAAPNMLNPTSVVGSTTTLELTTSAQTLVNNAASSNTVVKVHSLYVSNVDGTNAASVTVNYYTQDDIGGTARAIAHQIVVPADATLVVIAQDTPVYLEEDRSIGALASAAGDLEAVVSYEVVS